MGGLLLALSSPLAQAKDDEAAAQQRAQDRRELLRELDRNTQIIKERALDLEHALYRLELDQNMHPLQETRGFFNVQTKHNFLVQHIRVELGDVVILENSYHPTEAKALQQIGADRIFHGSVPPGPHQIKAYIEGYFKSGDQILAYQTSAVFDFDKTRGLSHLLLTLEDSRSDWEPQLALKVWQ